MKPLRTQRACLVRSRALFRHPLSGLCCLLYTLYDTLHEELLSGQVAACPAVYRKTH